MAKKKNLVKCAIHEIGLQLLAHPDGVDTWTITRGHISGNWNFFHHFDRRISGRIRIPVSSNHYLIEQFEQDLEYKEIRSDGVKDTTVVNAVLVDFMCRNIGLSIGLTRKPKGIEISLDERDFLDELRKQIWNCFREDLAWTHLDETMKRGVYFFGFAAIFVDDLSKFQQKIAEIGSVQFTMHKSGILAFHLGSGIEELRFPLYRLGMSDLHLFVLEDREVSDWLDSGVISKGHSSAFANLRKHVDYVLYSNRLTVIKRQMIMVNGRCTALLESLPEHKPQSISAREELMQKLTGISEELAFYRSTHLLAKNFLLHEETAEEIPESVKPEPKKDILEGELDILGEHLLLLEQALQTRLMIENMTVSRYREEQQKRTEKSFQLLSFTVSIFIIFEILAALFAWALTPNDTISWFLWIILVASPFVLIYLLRREYQKMTSLKLEHGAG